MSCSVLSSSVRSDFAQRTRYLNAVNTFKELLSMGVVPIVNENDTVSVSVSALTSISYNGTPLADLVMLRTGPSREWPLHPSATRIGTLTFC